MNLKRISLLCLLHAAAITSIGCGGSGSGGQQGPTAGVETEYSNGYQNMGYGLVDPGVKLLVTSTDPSCPQQLPTTNITTHSDGTASLATPCAQMGINVWRYPSTNCKATNGYDPNGNPWWQYQPFNVYWGSSATPLPCDIPNVLTVVSPVQMDNTQSVEVQLSTQAGAFDNTWGPPVVYMSDELGDVYGPVSADSVSADGSTITFSTQALFTRSDGTATPDNYVVAALNYHPIVCYGSFGGCNPSTTYTGVAAATLQVTAPAPSDPGDGDPGGQCLPHKPCLNY